MKVKSNVRAGLALRVGGPVISSRCTGVIVIA